MNLPFHKLCWMPLDLPVFGFNDQVISEYVEESIPYAHGIQRLTEKNFKYGKSKWLPNLGSGQQKLVEYINQHIPFTDLINVKVHRQNDYGMKHRHTDFFQPNDNLETYNHTHENEPAGYRMVLRGKIKKALAVETNAGVYFPELPDDTDWYIMGHTNVWHWNTADDPDRYIIYFHAWLDKDKHIELLTKSFSKYGHLAIWQT